MNNFIYNNPTRVYFGTDAMESLSKEILKIGKKVLMVYGGGSIKRNGLYDLVVKQAEEAGIELFELSGVEPNPRHTTANKGARICKEKGIEVVLAVGGGSTIDCAKGIAAATKRNDGDVWQIVETGEWVTDALPVIAVLTNAATGSEMDAWAVISNMDINVKVGIGGSALVPVVAFENPEYSMTLPKYQTACGAFDIFNHVIDNYYLANEATFDMVMEMQESVMRAVVKWAPIAMAQPDNYEARANLMWASSMALNTVLDAGSVHAPVCHALEHELSAYYDITHGHGLAIVTPRWLTYILNEKSAPAIARLGVKVFGLPENNDVMQGAKDAIKALEKFCFETLELSATLESVGIDETNLEKMAKHIAGDGEMPCPYGKLSSDDLLAIYRMCL